MTTGTESTTPKPDAQVKIDALRDLDDKDRALWQFFESRADALKSGLWTTATWLLGLQGALLAFILGDRLTDVGSADGWLRPKVPSVVALLSGLGVGVAAMTWGVVSDTARHIHRNWDRASAAKKDYGAALRGGVISVLLPVRFLVLFFAVAFATLHVRAFSGAWPDAVGLVTALAAVLVVASSDLGVFDDRPDPPATDSNAAAGGIAAETPPPSRPL